MGIIGRNHSKQGKSNGTTVIAAGTELVGNLALEDNLHIDGRISGDVESKAEVVIGQAGHMEGRVQAKRVLVSGSFDGTIEAERLEIVASGKVTGEVTVGQLVVESGAHFNGTSRIRGDEPPRQLTHASEPASDQPEQPSAGESKAPGKKASRKESADETA
ncbi:bactofilin family protein [Wenzhouxiangella limi]|uniref:Polymer-forming cytoskeletal protein n=1 Tax=Wenzhouxiangella limi TaxID=2707351 RepID=A0A845UVB9_9GAMM|nr:polymer-forming cytoskeletal protein [Wenzhouxiangella limi]NDY94484.1 polymer-forming cytoskeletal protein [Wenzhouxiangella limi]